MTFPITVTSFILSACRFSVTFTFINADVLPEQEVIETVLSSESFRFSRRLHIIFLEIFALI